MRTHRSWNVTLALGVTLVAGSAAGQPPPEHGVARNASEMKMGPIAGLPTCIQGAVAAGDPANSGFVVYVKGKAGCTIPYHWHSANERVIIVSGTARMSMREMGDMPKGDAPKGDAPKGDKSDTAKGESAPVMLKAGGFVELPAKHVHQLKCTDACTLYVLSDGKFDIHYVDPDGKEIPAEQAMKPINQTVAAQ
jgi:quercetin dioxygenase-like cupin family protein